MAKKPGQYTGLPSQCITSPKSMRMAMIATEGSNFLSSLEDMRMLMDGLAAVLSVCVHKEIKKGPTLGLFLNDY